MKTVKVFHYDAFTKTAGKGNPAGVIFVAETYTTNEMQEIARQIGFSECAFVLPSQKADLQLRYFTPGAEVNLCGHATVASIFALYNGLAAEDAPIRKRVETKAGIIDIVYRPDTKEVSMTQAAAVFEPFTGNVKALLGTIGLNAEDLDPRYPVVYGSTGLWTLILPVKTLDACSRMVPDHHAFPPVLTERPNTSVHPLCVETIHPEATLHGRHFSAAITGRVEDPITGTACGVMGAYYITFMDPGMESCDILIEQGQEAGYDGLVHVWAHKTGGSTEVQIAGTAVYVEDLQAQI
ncbi:MAG: PhzF family phenazine biosynthesis isomerase [Eubacteriales bacterium]|jgi:PhzF family phenazine biosynthesis protein|nr:PhzF family phenazine biosynthesis isomerase [Eubacteriales bacterium]MDD3289527.1 PhzF family phenazine biosynthesis isomerase [Eubacteriales bacterium]MDD3863192.1 PhzF family phenazine biosynthesis isomerase [Eubacteriales bacterium]MDD4444815.1 PhzF family phenazine biosynthesis isomerase [Eubacteriales bacterium]